MLPASMGILFVLLAMGMLELDRSGIGKELTERFKWLSLAEGSTALTIVSTITTSIISLTVFSFSMVMLVMNQAASQMSNRMVVSIIGDKAQKYILSIYIGTIIFALFLLNNISAEDDANVPVLSVYMLVALIIIDVFLFVFFLHHITQLFRYEHLIKRIHDKALVAIKQIHQKPNWYKLDDETSIHDDKKVNGGIHEVSSPVSGYYQGFNESDLIGFLIKHDVIVRFLHVSGRYLLKGTPLMHINKHLSEFEIKTMLNTINYLHRQEIDQNVYYGFFHLQEVAVKALSPGINDPGTAVLCLNSLANLFYTIIAEPFTDSIKDSEGNTRVITKQYTVPELFEKSMMAIYDYGKNDRTIMTTFTNILNQLVINSPDAETRNFFLFKLKELHV
jgi:uncharacterized membrane protein